VPILSKPLQAAFFHESVMSSLSALEVFFLMKGNWQKTAHKM